MLLIFSLIAVVQAAQAGGINFDRNLSNSLNSRVLTRCIAPASFLVNNVQASADALTDGQLLPIQEDDIRLITLMKQGGIYQLLLDDEPLNNIGNLQVAANDGLSIHLLLEREYGAEHLVFMLNPDGTGELLWSSRENNSLTSCETKQADTWARLQ